MRCWIVLAAVFVVGCHSVAPDAGFEGVIIRKPMIFGHGGVDETPIRTGRSYVAWTTSGEYVNMQPLRLDLDFDDLMTRNGVPLDFHAVLNCRVTDSVKLVIGFGNDMSGKIPGWFARNLEQPFRTAVRDAVKKHDMNEMAISATASEQVDQEVTSHLAELIKESGAPVVCRDISLGRANPPDAIKNQRIATAEQEQRVNTETQRKIAEDTRKAAEESRAAADAAYNARMNSTGGQSLPPELMLRLREIEMKRDVCARANCTFWFGETLPTPVVAAK
jgi:uncharacterized membrane protein YqiK